MRKKKKRKHSRKNKKITQKYALKKLKKQKF